MSQFRWQWSFLVGWLCFGLCRTLHADPCGMVPPIYMGPGDPITRVGPQKTFVFYKNGIESIVLRPAFSGKVDNFGMLIPFPSPPAIRKVADNIFSHIAAAIDPPEVRVWIRRYRYYKRGRGMAMPSAAPKKSAAPPKDEVRVLRQEAVGMYQVAVLEAGSPKALKKWMTHHGYVYPKGMDKVVLDYIRARWCFVAVKTRVAGTSGIQPRPGMRKARPTFPRGGSFQGAVQAMGFRFRTPKLVVPMRLSAYNKGRLRNVVYLLTDKPSRIRHIPQELVRRQLSGAELYRNVTELLPLRVFGGKPSQIRPYRWRWIQQRRNPEPHNGLAKELFAADLLAVRQGKLALPHEEQKKVLLRIGERLELRGHQIDALNRQALSDARARTVELALNDLKKMTMTVVDGDFAREILARENLTFASYRMPQSKNNAIAYHARMLGAAAPWAQRGGIVTRWKGPKEARQWIPKQPRSRTAPPPRRVRNPRQQLLRWIRQFRDAEKVRSALAKVVKRGQAAEPYLWAEVIENQPIIPRGWALVALAEIGNPRTGGRLATIHQDGNQPLLLRTWAAAARIKITQTVGELLPLASLSYSFPSVQRPFSRRIMRMIQAKKKISLTQLLELSSRHYVLRRGLVPLILAKGAKPLVRVMVRGKGDPIRRQAAAYLATLGAKDPVGTAKLVIRAYRFRATAKDVPWKGGALFVPGLSWTKDTARQLVGHLLAWHLWCEIHAKRPLQRQIHNNIRSLSLAHVAGYQSPGWYDVGIVRWLVIWGKVVGCQGIVEMLKQQGVDQERRYQSVLGQLNCP